MTDGRRIKDSKKFVVPGTRKKNLCSQESASIFLSLNNKTPRRDFLGYIPGLKPHCSPSPPVILKVDGTRGERYSKHLVQYFLLTWQGGRHPIPFILIVATNYGCIKEQKA
jgi:hypothetical protein